MQEEVERMSAMVNQLLTLARAEAGEERVELEPVALASVVQPLVDAIQPVADEKGVTIGLIADPDVWALADAGRMRHLVLNLLNNALQHTPSGGRIDVTVSRSGHTPYLQVSDTGEGIPPEDLPHIFLRFYRGDRARQRGAGNAGLGLAIVRWIVDAHGGDIKVQSEPGRGARFTVTLQAAEAPVQTIVQTARVS
jgi:signal transduction histidine kinase